MKIGVNLFSVVRDLNNDYLGTLERIAQTGYEYVELLSGNWQTRTRFSESFPSHDLRKKFEEFGIRAFSAHDGVMPGMGGSEADWDPIINATRRRIREYFQIYIQYSKPTDYVDLGTGIFDFAKAYAKIKELGHVRYTIVENEGTQDDKFTSLASDLTFLKQCVEMPQLSLNSRFSIMI